MEWFRSLPKSDIDNAHSILTQWEEIDKDNETTDRTICLNYVTKKDKFDYSRWIIEFIYDDGGIDGGDIIQCRKCKMIGLSMGGNIYDENECPDCGNASK